MIVFVFSFFSLPQHIISQLGEERLLHKIGVVLFEELLGGLLGLHGSQFVSLGFESVDDVTDDSTLDSIGLDLTHQNKTKKNQSVSKIRHISVVKIP